MSTSPNFKQDDGEWTIEVNHATLHGSFERNSDGQGGGLWFQVVGRRSSAGATYELIDYDGMFELPMRVIKTLRAAGYVVDESFE